MKVKVVWFRNDLRITDNETLYRAVSGAGAVVPLYVLDTRLLATTRWGFNRTGTWRLQFLMESVRDLQERLRGLGADLLIKVGLPEEIVPEVCRQFGATEVFFTHEPAPAETAVENALQRNLYRINVNGEACGHSTLYARTQLPFSIPRMPDVFTVFRQRVEKNAVVDAALPAPARVNTPTGFTGSSIQLIQDVFEPAAADTRAVLAFQGGETAALERLHDFIWKNQALAHYHDTRNGLLGPDYSSKLSPWLSLGCLSARTIYHEIKRYEQTVGSNKSTYWLVFELLWRDFFHFCMEKHREAYFRPGGIRQMPLKNSRYNADVFQRWAMGKTGVDFIDANMQELLLTGFMSNRGRQNVASFLVHDLHQDWLAGAAWFEHLLIDYDVCSNYGNWAYIAGVGNDSRPGRQFNIQRQQEMYDPRGEYCRYWLNNTPQKQITQTSTHA